MSPLRDRFHCAECGDPLDLIATAYGWRAPCFACGIRWTQIRGESDWTAEPR